MSEQVEMFDPPPGAGGLPTKLPGFKLKKLVTSVPGGIRMVNKVGSALSAGTRAVEFIDGVLPRGLDEGEAAEMARIIEEYEASNDGSSPSAVEQLNLYCESRANRTIAEVYPFVNPETGGTSLLVFIDVFLSGEELADYEDANTEISALMEARKAKRKEQKEAAAQQEQEAERQKAADEQLGRTAREQNLVGQLRDSQDKLERVRKAANKLAKKAGVKDWAKDIDDAD